MNLGLKEGLQVGPFLGINPGLGGFPGSAAAWEARLGFALDWLASGDSGFADLVGSNDLDQTTGSPVIDESWPGLGGGKAYRQDGTTTQAIFSTATDFLSPGTGAFILFGAYKRGGEYDNSFAGIFDACNGNANGIRVFEENGAADDSIWLAGEAGGSSKNIEMDVGPYIGRTDIVWFLFSRTSAEQTDGWLAVEGSTEVLHKTDAVVASDAFTSSSAPAQIGANNGLGQMNPDVMVKGVGYAAGQVGTFDLFDLIRGTARKSVVEL